MVTKNSMKMNTQLYNRSNFSSEHFLTYGQNNMGTESDDVLSDTLEEYLSQTYNAFGLNIDNNIDLQCDFNNLHSNPDLLFQQNYVNEDRFVLHDYDSNNYNGDPTLQDFSPSNLGPLLNNIDLGNLDLPDDVLQPLDFESHFDFNFNDTLKSCDPLFESVKEDPLDNYAKESFDLTSFINGEYSPIKTSKQKSPDERPGGKKIDLKNCRYLVSDSSSGSSDESDSDELVENDGDDEDYVQEKEEEEEDDEDEFVDVVGDNETIFDKEESKTKVTVSKIIPRKDDKISSRTIKSSRGAFSKEIPVKASSSLKKAVSKKSNLKLKTKPEPTNKTVRRKSANHIENKPIIEAGDVKSLFEKFESTVNDSSIVKNQTADQSANKNVKQFFRYINGKRVLVEKTVDAKPDVKETRKPPNGKRAPAGKVDRAPAQIRNDKARGKSLKTELKPKTDKNLIKKIPEIKKEIKNNNKQRKTIQLIDLPLPDSYKFQRRRKIKKSEPSKTKETEKKEKQPEKQEKCQLEVKSNQFGSVANSNQSETIKPIQPEAAKSNQFDTIKSNQPENDQIIGFFPQRLIEQIQADKRKAEENKVNKTIKPPVKIEQNKPRTLQETAKHNTRLITNVLLDHNYAMTRDSGFGSCDEDDRNVLNRQPTIQAADGTVMVSLLKVNQVPNGVQSRKINFEEYKRRLQEKKKEIGLKSTAKAGGTLTNHANVNMASCNASIEYGTGNSVNLQLDWESRKVKEEIKTAKREPRTLKREQKVIKRDEKPEEIKRICVVSCGVNTDNTYAKVHEISKDHIAEFAPNSLIASIAENVPLSNAPLLVDDLRMVEVSRVKKQTVDKCCQTESTNKRKRLSSTSSSCSTSSSRSRSTSPQPAPKRRRRVSSERMREVEERRVVFVGKLSPGTSRDDLWRRFEKFGPINRVSVHLKENCNFGFVTFTYKEDAYCAVEHGNDDRSLPQYDLSFGGRRLFCQTSYADLDNVDDHVPPPPLTADNSKVSFQELLEDFQFLLQKQNMS